MPFIKVYIHFVWSTKNRVQCLKTKNTRLKVWQHIRDNAVTKDIHIDFISGYHDHCHCLVSLGADQSIQKIMQLIKGESAFWINQTQLIEEKFEWQDEYFAVSVSESMLNKVRDYIKRQEQHHQHKTFDDEHTEFIIKYQFEKFKDSSS